MKFTEKFNIKKENLELYEIFDRKPLFFDKEKHIYNITNIFLKMFNFPQEIKYKISEYIYYDSAPINLKILDFLIEINYNKNILIKNLNLINNNTKYLSGILLNNDHNTIFFDNPTAYENYYIGIPRKIPIDLFNYDI